MGMMLPVLSSKIVQPSLPGVYHKPMAILSDVLISVESNFLLNISPTVTNNLDRFVVGIKDPQILVWDFSLSIRSSRKYLLPPLKNAISEVWILIFLFLNCRPLFTSTVDRHYRLCHKLEFCRIRLIVPGFVFNLTSNHNSNHLIHIIP